MFSVFRLIVLLFCFKNAVCLQKQLCEGDEECFINALIERVYPRFVAGMPGVETSDPLHITVIIADQPNIRYQLFNASLSGLKNCEFVKIDFKRISGHTLFDYAISCPILTLQAQYDLNGIIDSTPVEGKGECQIIYENYYISISGKHEKIKDGEGKEHVNILEYAVVPDLKDGKVTDPEYTNLVFGNHDLCDADQVTVNYVRIIEEMTRDTVMNVFMNKYIQNLKKFHHQVPIEDLHFKYVRSVN